MHLWLQEDLREDFLNMDPRKLRAKFWSAAIAPPGYSSAAAVEPMAEFPTSPPGSPRGAKGALIGKGSSSSDSGQKRPVETDASALREQCEPDVCCVGH